MKHHSFQSLVQRITNLSTRGGRHVPVTWGGGSASTNGRVVNLPALPAGTILTPHQFAVYLGYALHEGPGHLTHTDLTLHLDEIQHENSPTFAYILNVLEDIRVENLDIKKYPGDEKYLNAAHEYQDSLIPPDKCQSPGLMGLVYKEAFTRYRGLDTHKIQGELDQSHPQIAALMQTLPTCTSTSDCINLAHKITKEIQNALPSPDNQQQASESSSPGNLSGSSSSDEDSGETTGSEQGGDTNQGQDNSPNDPPSPPSPSGSLSNDDDGTEQEDIANSNPAPNNPIGHGTPKDLGGNSTDDEDNNHTRSLSDLDDLAASWGTLTEIKNLIQSLTSQINSQNHIPGQSPPHTGDMILPPFDISRDRIFVPSTENLLQYLTTRARLAPQILALKKMFRIHLQAKDKRAWLRGLDEGPTLDRERLHVVAQGQTSVFKEKHDRPFINTAIELMLDLSSSMDGSMVRSSAIILTEALAPIPQLSLSICGFTTNRYSHQHPSQHSLIYGRFVGMDILLFKDYTEPYQKCRAKLGTIATGGSTPLGDAYGKALERILPRPEPRRIIFLVTDGMPSFRKSTYHSDYLLLEQVHHNARKLKVETMGLGIGDPQEVAYIKHYVDKFAHIQDIQSMPQTLMQVLKEVIK